MERPAPDWVGRVERTASERPMAIKKEDFHSIFCEAGLVISLFANITCIFGDLPVYCSRSIQNGFYRWFGCLHFAPLKSAPLSRLTQFAGAYIRLRSVIGWELTSSGIRLGCFADNNSFTHAIDTTYRGNMTRNRQTLTLILLSSILFTLTACDNTQFRAEIGEFQASMTASRSAIETYYLEMNQFERELYLLRRELDGTKPAGVEYMSDRAADDPFVFDDTNFYVNGPFTAESIQARLDALKLIGQYGTRLAELAGTDSPTVFADRTAALGTNVANLSGTFRRLARSEPTGLSAANYVEPISKLVGLVGRLYLERKRDRALVAAIREATPQISVINYYLKRDFEEIINPQRETGLRQTIKDLLLNYNRNRAKSDRKARKQMLDEINAAVRTYELFRDADPSKVVEKMEEANKALFSYANSDRKKTDLTLMVLRFGEFRDYAEKIVRNVQEIRDLRRNLKNANG